jgi:DNA-binding response OmpR family regulator
MSNIPSVPVAEVVVLQWPEDDHLRRKLAHEAVPRILVAAPECRPPEIDDELEDWIREPFSLWDLQCRADTLRARAHHRSLRPRIDDDALVWVGPRWVPIPRAQCTVVELLVEQFERVVSIDVIVEVYIASGGSGKASAIKAVMGRVAHRLTDVGLVLRNVRGCGYLLELDVRKP